MNITLDRQDDQDGNPIRVVWMAEDGRENEFIFVLISGGSPAPLADTDVSHLGFDVEGAAAVDAIAKKAASAGILAWEPRELPPPVGYFCGLHDPDGRIVEFSCDQPIGRNT